MEQAPNSNNNVGNVNIMDFVVARTISRNIEEILEDAVVTVPHLSVDMEFRPKNPNNGDPRIIALRVQHRALMSIIAYRVARMESKKMEDGDIEKDIPRLLAELCEINEQDAAERHDGGEKKEQ